MIQQTIKILNINIPIMNDNHLMICSNNFQVALLMPVSISLTKSTSSSSCLKSTSSKHPRLSTKRIIKFIKELSLHCFLLKNSSVNFWFTFHFWVSLKKDWGTNYWECSQYKIKSRTSTGFQSFLSSFSLK